MGRESALVALEELIENISISTGYEVDIKSVSRQFRNIDDVAATEIPMVIIEDDGEEIINWNTGGFADVSFEVNLVGYVVSNDELSTKLNNLDRQVLKAIGSDLTLGGVVSDITPLPYTERSGTQFAPYAFFVRPVQITYEGQLSEGL